MTKHLTVIIVRTYLCFHTLTLYLIITLYFMHCFCCNRVRLSSLFNFLVFFFRNKTCACFHIFLSSSIIESTEKKTNMVWKRGHAFKKTILDRKRKPNHNIFEIYFNLNIADSFCSLTLLWFACYFLCCFLKYIPQTANPFYLTCGCATTKWGGRGDRRCDRWSKASTAVTWRSRYIPTGHWAW